MASDYEKLAEEFKDNKDVLIAEGIHTWQYLLIFLFALFITHRHVHSVDCTSKENEELCAQNGIEGFPTLKYGDAFAFETYEGPRTFDALLSFSKENLKPSCSPSNISLCDTEKKAIIEKYSAMTEDELYDQISKVEDIISEADSYLQSEIEKLQEAYEQVMTKASEMKKSAKTESSYGIMKAVMGLKKESSKKDEL